MIDSEMEWKDYAIGAGMALLPAVPLELLGQAPAALAAGAVAFVVAGVWHKEIVTFVQQRGPALQSAEGLKKWLKSRPGEQVTETNVVDALPAQDVFGSSAQVQAQPTQGPRRLSIAECVEHTKKNSYRIPFGLSLSDEKRPVYMNFFKRHMKLIGASTKGKSSMAGALLKIITATHDTDHVLVALLDKENRTSRLFEDLPHIAEVMVDDTPVLLHARNNDEVLLHLGYIVAIIRDRYDMPETERQQLPIVLVYLEEFIALKDEFKQRIIMTKDEKAKEQAKKDYASLVYRIKEIARMGLKARVQLLLCAQVDYRDEDLQEALINVSCGMSFCVRPSAAQAAGFMQTELLNKNARSKGVGEAVVEMPDCTDLVLAPDFDLEALLLELEKQEAAQGKYEPVWNENRIPFVTAANGHTSKSTTVLDRQEYYRPMAAPPTVKLEPSAVKPSLVPFVPAEDEPTGQPIPTYEDAIEARNEWVTDNGSEISRRELQTELISRGFDCNEYVARKHYDQMRKELKSVESGIVG